MSGSTAGPVSGGPPPLHGPGAPWPETNCALDLWVELLRHLGHEPAAAGGVAVEGDCHGDHWVMTAPTREDLRELYGLEVVEFSGWSSTLDHVVDHLARGHHLTVEVDSWWLPDTAGTAYRADHVKTSIAPLVVDTLARTMDYLHNAGRFTLSGEDFDGVFSADPEVTRVPLPYLELVRQHDVPGGDPRDRALELLRRHHARRAEGDPVARLEEALRGVDWSVADDAAFHRISFATVRQLGATAQLAAAHLGWLGLEAAATPFSAAAQAATTAQFSLARTARRGRPPADGLLTGVSEGWGAGMTELARALRP